MTNAVEDNFETYYREKIWEMIPAYYRHEDGIADPPHVLRGLVEVIARQAADVRRSHDQLWQDQYIEQCQDWAVPYIGDLLATRLLSAHNSRGRRVDVAKTIYYRRRKGTLGVLEELVGDITGWEGKVVESFKRLARARHGLDPEPQKFAGRITGTLAGGVADLRHTWGAELTNTAFDEYYHTPDFRQHRGTLGRYNIPKLAVHLYRLQANRVDGVTPFRLDDFRYSFDPSGREIQLFSPRVREDNWHNWCSIEAWQLPAPITCRLLNHSEFRIGTGLLLRLANNFGVDTAALEKLRRLSLEVIKGEERLQTLIELMNEPTLLLPAVNQHILNTALVDNCGKHGLIPNAVAVYKNELIHQCAEVAATDLKNWPVDDAGKGALIDPALSRLQLFGATPHFLTVDYHYGFSGDIGAGTHARPQVETVEANTEISGGGAMNAADLHNDGVTQIIDNATYGPLSDKLRVHYLTLQAANGTRPYIIMETNWVLRCAAEEDDATVWLDGLWLGSSDDDNEVILRGDGDYESVTIRHCTFDPGGSRNIAGDLIWPVRLVIEGKIEKLRIENSILSQISLRHDGMIEELEIVDSIIDVDSHVEIWGNAEPKHNIALNLPTTEVRLERVTVFGRVDVNRLWATETIFTGVADVTDTQTGCFRFSSAPTGSRLPTAYESYFLDTSVYNNAGGLFTSQILGHHGYGQLSQAAPVEISKGAENGSEMGAFSNELGPIKRANLETKINEYMPFGLIPFFILET